MLNAIDRRDFLLGLAAAGGAAVLATGPAGAAAPAAPDAPVAVSTPIAMGHHPET
ncbi:MAG: twin-arginine translocation signal domain-containing protein [Inquilinus sp.]|uniref:twin-arginine translocation signal domain-containing protein n=1 Tax=Inquilinus sp. TaxID=1932117 RepID=UPI003F3717F9